MSQYGNPYTSYGNGAQPTGGSGGGEGQGPYGNPYNAQSYTNQSQYSMASQYSAPPAAPTAPAHQQQLQTQTQESYEMQSNPFGEVDDVKKLLAQYDDQVNRIEIQHKRSLAATNIEDEQFAQRELDELISQTRGLGDQLKGQIKQLQASSKGSSQRVQAENLKSTFMTSIQRFQASEASFRQRYRQAAERQYRIVDPQATDAEVQQAIDDSSGQQVFSQALLQSNRQGEARQALTEVQQRHREIQKIEATMAELAQLFNDMEVMVAEQDNAIQAIDHNTYKAQHDVEMGVGAQQSAIRSARAWRKKKWWCAGIILFIVVVLALVLGLYFGLHDN